MRYRFFVAFVVICWAGAIRGDQAASSYHLVDVAILTRGEKVAGSIGSCLMGQNNKPRICFGLIKELDGNPKFTFLALFRTGKKNCNPTGSQSEFKSDGSITIMKNTYELGEFELPLSFEKKHDPKSNKVIFSKVIVGTLEATGKESGVVLVDLTGQKPTYKLVKADLPICKINLADKDRKTWVKVIDDTIAELKKKSKELRTLVD